MIDARFIHEIAAKAEASLKRANAAAQQIRATAEMLKKGEEMTISRFNSLEKLLAGRRPTYAERIVACAEHVIPFFYVVDIAFATAASARTPGVINIDQEGYFLADRYYACWRPTLGANAGEFKPVSSGNPYIAGAEAIAGAEIADKMDFVWELVEGSSQRARQNAPIPGDILYRADADGYLTEPDVFPPSTTLTVVVTPTQPVDTTGTFSFVVQGRQCLNVIENEV